MDYQELVKQQKLLKLHLLKLELNNEDYKPMYRYDFDSNEIVKAVWDVPIYGQEMGLSILREKFPYMDESYAKEYLSETPLYLMGLISTDVKYIKNSLEVLIEVGKQRERAIKPLYKIYEQNGR